MDCMQITRFVMGAVYITPWSNITDGLVKVRVLMGIIHKMACSEYTREICEAT